ncbi:MAG: polysaccharide biosynthesis C-terminal domain-containing protein [Clostridia bacterium]|nr:polysaccharide biosynthesis C-terminal domain-containing protein [Clostridia bacterium]
MTSKRIFIRNGILLGAVGVLSRTVGLFFGAYVTRTVGAAGMGMYTLLMTVFGFAVTFATSGVGLTVTRLAADAMGDGDPARMSRVLRSCIFYAAGFGLFGTFLLLCLARPLSVLTVGDGSGVPALCVLALSLCPIALSSVLSGYFVSLRHVGKNALTQIFTQGAKILVTVLFLPKAAVSGAASSCLFLSAVSAGSDTVCLLLLFLLFCSEKREPAGEGSEMRSVFGMAIPLAVSAYIRQALITVEHILIPKRLRLHGATPEESLASYGVLQGMALPILLYPMAPLTSFSGLLVPEFAECRSSGRQDRMSRAASLAVSRTPIYGITLSAITWPFSSEHRYTVYRSYEAGKLIAALAPVVPIMYLDHVTDAMLKGIGEQVYSMWVNISDAALSVLLVFFLLPEFGIMGYVGAILGMEAYNFVLSYARLKKRVSFRVPLSFAVVLPALCAAASAWISGRLFGFSMAEATPFRLISEMLFAVCLFLFFFTAAKNLLFKNKSGTFV